MDKGWIKLHRQIDDNHFLTRDMKCWYVFTRLLVMAGRSKGEVAGGKYDLAERFCMNPSAFYRTMLRLEKEGMVNRKVNHRYTVYSICNWARYQSQSEPQSEPEVNHRRTTGEHYNKKENKKRIYSAVEILEPALTEFIKMRKLIKKPMTDEAVKRLTAKLQTMYPDNPDRQQACLLQSVDHNWQSVYELKTETAGTRKETDAWL
jgi:hypothetical protein